METTTSIVEPEKQEIFVKIGKIEVTHNPHTLVILGLGSCIGVALYDKDAHVGGLAHVMLPDSTKFVNQTDTDKFADIAIPKLIDEMICFGAKKQNIVAKIAGGAQMFAMNAASDVSLLNIEAVKKNLAKEMIHLIAEDTGGNTGRTIRFDTVTGMIEVSTKMNEKVYQI